MWKHVSSLAKKFWAQFWDMKWPIKIDFLEKGANENNASYCRLIIHRMTLIYIYIYIERERERERSYNGKLKAQRYQKNNYYIMNGQVVLPIIFSSVLLLPMNSFRNYLKIFLVCLLLGYHAYFRYTMDSSNEDITFDCNALWEFAS